MDPIRGDSVYNLQASSAASTEAAQAAAGTHPSGHASKLTLAMLSHHTPNALNTKETQGDKKEKNLAKSAKETIRSGLKLSPNQPANGITQFGAQHGLEVLVIQAKLNERSEYDVLGVAFRRGFEESVSMKFPAPSSYAKSPLESMPMELIHMMLDNIPNGGPKSRATSLALSSKGVYALAIDKIKVKAKCSALIDRLAVIDTFTVEGRRRSQGASATPHVRCCHVYPIQTLEY
jgi:hypothetical protein